MGTLHLANVRISIFGHVHTMYIRSAHFHGLMKLTCIYIHSTNDAVTYIMHLVLCTVLYATEEDHS